MRNANPAKRDMIAGAERMHVHAGADSYIAQRSRLYGFRAHKVLRSCELDIAGLASETR